MSNALEESYGFCVELSRKEARNFYYSFLLLPKARRESMCALYAFMRHTDDLADQPGTPDEKKTALADWRSALRSVLEGGEPAWPGLLALADTVRRHGVPLRHLEEVIDGVSMDIEPQPYRTFDELYKYCYHVASAVGLSCIHIWGYRSEGGKAERLAEACGIALQLTNILRDVKEDAKLGRIYLPEEDLERFSVAREELSAAQPNERVRRLFEFEGKRAYDYYAQAGSLARLVAPVGRPVLGAIVGIYRALLDEIVRRDYDVLAGRVSLPAWRKSLITARALASGLPLFSGR
jgi:phytoene synthase